MRSRRRKVPGQAISARRRNRRAWSRSPVDRTALTAFLRSGAGRILTVLSFDQAYVAGARSLRRFLGRKFHTLPLSEQLEHSTADGAAMEEVLGAALVADKPESLVDEEACDCPG